MFADALQTRQNTHALSQFDLLVNQTPAEILKRLQTVDHMDKLKELFVKGMDHVQECIPEDVELKKKLFYIG